MAKTKKAKTTVCSKRGKAQAFAKMTPAQAKAAAKTIRSVCAMSPAKRKSLGIKLVKISGWGKMSTAQARQQTKMIAKFKRMSPAQRKQLGIKVGTF